MKYLKVLLFTFLISLISISNVKAFSGLDLIAHNNLTYRDIFGSSATSIYNAELNLIDNAEFDLSTSLEWFAPVGMSEYIDNKVFLTDLGTYSAPYFWTINQDDIITGDVFYSSADVSVNEEVVYIRFHTTYSNSGAPNTIPIEGVYIIYSPEVDKVYNLRSMTYFDENDLYYGFNDIRVLYQISTGGIHNSGVYTIDNVLLVNLTDIFINDLPSFSKFEYILQQYEMIIELEYDVDLDLEVDVRTPIPVFKALFGVLTMEGGFVDVAGDWIFESHAFPIIPYIYEIEFTPINILGFVGLPAIFVLAVIKWIKG